MTGHIIDLEKYPFHKIVMNMFDCDNLLLLHEHYGQNLVMPNYDFQPGMDQGTYFHRHFYEIINRSPEFLNLYKAFIRDFFLGWYLPGELLYQKIPTFRVHLPNNKAVGGRSHKDSDYNHPLGEINYLVPLTSMQGTSSVFYESSPGLKDFHFINLRPGQIWEFNGNQCEHGNLPNTTGWTRVSFDFRIITRKDLALANQSLQSVAHGIKFTEGEYYEAL